MGLFAVDSLYATKNKAPRVQKSNQNVTDNFFSCVLSPEFINFPAGANSDGQSHHTKQNPAKTGWLILRLPSNGTFI